MNLEVITREPVGQAKPTPLLFVPGAWHAAWCWDVHFLSFFASHGYRSHALSLRGHGKSDGHQRIRWTRIREYVEDVAQVAAGLPAPPVLIGHSMGGFVVQKYLETRTAPLGVLLASAPARGIIPATMRLLKQQPVAWLVSNLTMSPYRLIATPELAHYFLFSQNAPASLSATYQPLLEQESLMAFFGMMMLELPEPNRVKSPILILGAANDRVFSATDTKRTSVAYNTTATFFPDMAHDMMIEERWEDPANRILKELSERGL